MGVVDVRAITCGALAGLAIVAAVVLAVTTLATGRVVPEVLALASGLIALAGTCAGFVVGLYSSPNTPAADASAVGDASDDLIDA